VDWAISLVASLGLAYLLLFDPSSGWLDQGFGLLALVVAFVCLGAILRPATEAEVPHPPRVWDVLGPVFFPAQLLIQGSDRDWRFALAGGITLVAAIAVQVMIWRASPTLTDRGRSSATT
jgi:hypothetical protein